MTWGPTKLGDALPSVQRVEAVPDVGAVRRLAATAARAQGFDSHGEARLALVATEMATNLLKHARGGEIRVILCRVAAVGGVTLLSTDSGPGMTDAVGNMIDGFSTAGTLGAGLGTIKRASDFVDLHSVPGLGTVLMSQCWASAPPALPRRMFRAGAIGDAHPGERVSGDAWAVEQRGDVVTVVVVDGLGHGVEAECAASAAVESFRAHADALVESIVAQIHTDLRNTRGAAVAVASIDRKSHLLRFCGIGNIAGRVFGPSTSSSALVSRFGIAGHQVRKVQAFDLDWTADSLLVLHSDGISASWDLDVGSLWRHHPLVVAATVMRAGARGHDDATVLVIDENLEVELGGEISSC